MGGVPPGDVQAAGVLTGLGMALWLAVDYVPALRRHIGVVRGGLLAAYVVACAAIVIHALTGQ